MDKNKLTIKVDADTSEALKQMKEVTEAANECVEALEKLDRVMGKFANPNETVEWFCDGKAIAQTIVSNKE
ncbi:hypothetical protein EKA14_19595 [Bacillus mycoides]|nr:hypothetical protein EKA14_19595 [Bacillus mycoides]